MELVPVLVLEDFLALALVLVLVLALLNRFPTISMLQRYVTRLPSAIAHS